MLSANHMPLFFDDNEYKQNIFRLWKEIGASPRKKQKKVHFLQFILRLIIIKGQYQRQLYRHYHYHRSIYAKYAAKYLSLLNKTSAIIKILL